MARWLLGAAGAGLMVATGACSMAPDYHAPETASVPAFKEVAGWSPAHPADAAARGPWWQSYGDPVLDDLEARAEAASPTLAAALARYDSARAAAREAGADLLPTASVNGSAARDRVSAGRPLSTGRAVTYDDYIVGGSLSYEVDLWGRVRNSARASAAEADASKADLASARLSLQASVADAYFRLRGLDAEARLLAQSVDAFARAYELTKTRHEGGIASGIDVNRAHTVLANAQALVAENANQRAATEHELAALTGAVASQFTLASTADTALPTPFVAAVGTPSTLLERRPDVAAAERRVFAANAEIGVARAAFFPSLTLGASGGWRTTHGDIFSAPNTFWGLGPLSSVLTLFDGGKRKAQVRMARADYEAIAANYRQTVLTAFREVEDAIAAQRQLAAQGAAQKEAADAAGRTSEIAMSRYRDGASDYLEVVTAQTDALSAKRAYILVETQRMQASVALVRALGGTGSA
ncbi:efflux transporter outer membrane subunit [Novosphingobium profundi]|nr:efflux transporter outer membrane subunit [Novosphingobium profundi]MBT0668008.1 efflux transporter outer membrane subunit [Novosphingobium profundi]